MTDIATLAAHVDEAARTATAIPQLSESSNISLAEAYDIQTASIARRLKRGEKRVGMKMGFTSRAKMVQMGLNDMIWGRLTDGMMVEDGGAIDMSRYVHPRVEPEVAFLLEGAALGHGQPGPGDGGGGCRGARARDHRFALQGLQVLAVRRRRRQQLVLGLRRRPVVPARPGRWPISAWC